MVTSAASIVGLDSLGRLLSIPKWNTVGRLESRGSLRTVGAGAGGGAIGRGKERTMGGVKFIRRRSGRRGESLDGVAVRATAADDVEQEEELEQEEDTEEGAASDSSSSPSCSERDHQLSSRQSSQTSRSRHSNNSRKQSGNRIPSIFSSIVDEWSNFTSVREKGDVRDVVLMSLSFAVLIYISQHLVHAYCAFRHMYFKHY